MVTFRISGYTGSINQKWRTHFSGQIGHGNKWGQQDWNQLRAVNKLLKRGLRQLEIVDISSSGEHSGTTQGVVGAVPVSAVVMDIALELRGLIPYQTR